jgi:hypothetical protein
MQFSQALFHNFYPFKTKRIANRIHFRLFIKLPISKSINKQKYKNMKKVIINLLLTLNILLLALVSYGQSYIGDFEVTNINSEYFCVSGSNNIPIDEKHIIISYVAKTSESAISSFEQINNLNQYGIFDGYYIYNLPIITDYLAFCQQLEQNPIVAYIEVSLVFELYEEFVPNDYDVDQWYIDLLNIKETWSITTGSDDIIVAVLDTGLDIDDEEFGEDDTPISNIFENPGEDSWIYWDSPDYGNGIDGSDINTYIDDWRGMDFFNTNFNGQTFVNFSIDNDVRPQYIQGATYCGSPDIMNHGNWVASLISAKNNNDEKLTGIAGGDVLTAKGGVKVLPIKVGDWVPGGCLYYELYTPAVVAGLSYAREMNADIINMSFGIPFPSSGANSVSHQINLAYDEGILLVAAAGNNSSTIGVSYPALKREVIAVGAIDENDDYATFSDRGPDLEIMAPGVDIDTWDDNNLNGTSFSSPIVCATAALMKSVNPALTNTQIRDLLKQTAYKNPSYNFNNSNNIWNDPNWNAYFGFGRVDTYSAVCAAIDLIPQKTITGNETWDKDTYSNYDISIEPGATLTITGTLKMDPNTKIIVKQGAKLIVNGGTITNLPNCVGDQLKWAGIEVWGDPGESQQCVNGNYEQGYLELNNATISNAKTAVALRKEGTWSSYGGGIVKAYNSNFINNEKSVHFAPFKNIVTIGSYTYEADNEAVFRNCLFEINQKYFPDTDFQKHADVVEVRGVDFLSCDFKRLSNDNTSNYCSGIATYSGGVNVTDYNNDPSRFEGLYAGIVLSYNSTTSAYASFIRNSEFSNNSIGIMLNPNPNLVTIQDNIFHVGYNDPDKGICGISQSFGIYLYSSNTFVIEDNYFDKYTQAPSAGEYFGIRADNTQTTNDEIFRNTFSGLNFANYAIDKNFYIYTQGLEYYCNEHSFNMNDLFFTNSNGSSNTGVQQSQGNINKSTGNTFTQNISGFNLYNNTGCLVDYFYNVAENDEIPFSYTAATVIPHPQILAAECGSGIGIDPIGKSAAEKQQMETEFNNIDSNYEIVKNLYESLEDGGNTESLLTEVSTSWPNEMWELRAELLGLSPYLSQEILKTAADKTDVLPESVLFEILSANPDELKNNDLMQYLENKEQPLPSYMISILKQVSQGLTAKSALLGDMALYKRNKDRIARQMLASLHFDEQFDYESYRLWLSRLGGLQNDRKCIASLISEGNIEDALDLAEILPDIYQLEGDDLQEYNQYLILLNLDITLMENNSNPEELNAQDLDMLEGIAQSTGYAAAQAQAFLSHFYNEHYCNCANTNVNENKSSDANINPNMWAQAMGLTITTEPNPASNWVSFNYSLPVGSETANLIIRNGEGKVVDSFQLSRGASQFVWDTRSVKSGTYIFEFNSNDIQQTGKIVIIK